MFPLRSKSCGACGPRNHARSFQPIGVGSNAGSSATSLSSPVADADNFRDELVVELRSAEPGAEIYYSAEPDPASPRSLLYEGPIHLSESRTVGFYARMGDRISNSAESYFHRIPNEWRVEVTSVPNPQYTAGGPLALIDGRFGADDWRTGAWHGYQDQDFVAVLDLGRAQTLRRVGASFLQDARSWIWMPKRLVVEASTDGRRFEEVARFQHGIPDDAYGIFRETLEGPVSDIQARYLRFEAENYGTIPDWHLGAGGEAFIFVDELLVQLR